MAVLRLIWLGPPGIEYDGRPLQLEMRKTLALLAYLSLSPQSPTRETLAALFWPEYDQLHAQSSLRRSLSSLSKSLPFGSLIADRERIGLKKADWLTIDVDEFREHLSYVNQHSHPVDAFCPECLSHLEQAVVIYRGNFLDGFNLKDCPEFDEWQYFQREALRSEYAGAIEKLAACFASQGQWDKAIPYARSWVAADRLNEAAQRTLISLLGRSGQRRAARRQYDALVKLLHEELGQKPEAETVELLRMLEVEPQEPKKSTSMTLLVEPLQTRTLEPLLKTKLFIPFSKGKKVFREQLLLKLNQIQEHALTILSAPAGFGKTTALAEWTKQSPLPVGWLSLDDADNHLVRFLTYLVAALQNVESDFGEEVHALIQSPQPLPTQAIVTNLIHAFEMIPFPFVWVLDDYQAIHAESIHEVLALLLDRLPVNVHLVISTRADPPLSLARLRVQGKLLEIRAEDLRFTTEEILVFFNEVMGLGVSPEDIALLEERTEGWVVGLQLAALSLQRSPDKSQTIQAFSGTNRYILDYLLEEVIVRQPGYVQDFLLQTSILEQMNGSLCDAVTGIREWSIGSQPPISIHSLPLSSQEILEYLERSNLFVQSLDDERCWYRYHHLFAELLRVRLEHSFPDLVASLHRRTSEWHEQNGFIPAAVRHALLSKSFDYAAGVIERAVETNIIWSSGDLALLLSWVEELPAEVLFMHPLLRIYLCSAFYVTGDFKKSNQILEGLGKSLPEILKTIPKPVKVEQLFLSFRVLHEATKGDISRAIEDFSKLQTLLSDDEFVKFYGRNYLLLAYVVAGDVKNALRIAQPSYEAFITSGYALQALSNAKNTADIYILQGRLGEAIDICRRAIERCKLSGVSNPVAGIVGLSIGAVLLERNELEMAENYVQESLDLLARGPLGYDFGQGYALLAMIKQAQGERERAVQLIDHALQIAEHAGIPRINQLIQAYRTRIWLAQGANDLASNWASVYQLIGPTEYPREIEDLTLAQVLIIQKRYPEACALLDGLRSKAVSEGRGGRAIEILVLLSLVHFLQNRIEEALDLLEESLRAAYPERYMRVYLDKGEPVRDLLTRYKDKRSGGSKYIQPEAVELSGYIDRLLIAFE